MCASKLGRHPFILYITGPSPPHVLYFLPAANINPIVKVHRGVAVGRDEAKSIAELDPLTNPGNS
jgi:hypothetical protein